MATRREVLETLGPPVLASIALPFLNGNASAIASELQGHTAPPDATMQDEDFWSQVQQAFTVDRSMINLNNGGVSPSPAMVQDAMKRHLDYSNLAPVYTMWRVLEPRRETVRQRLARAWDVDPEEIALTRNASESLQICQFGIDLEPGDEIVTTSQDYPRMLTTFRQRERREGVTLKLIEIPVPAEDPNEIIDRFRAAITDQTRLILASHVINISGQVLPVKEIAALGRARGIPVIIDGAHAFAHLDFTLAELDCDYYATSLHKWLFAPHGTGLLYVRRDRIRDTWPLMAAEETQDDDIRKFEQIGTHPAANTLAIAEALTFHQSIGNARKLQRLLYLRDYWAQRLIENDRVQLHTSLKPGAACAIATVNIEGVDPGDLTRHLWVNHRIIVTPVKHEQFQGIRVTPSVYTTLPELNRFCDAMGDVIVNGV